MGQAISKQHPAVVLRSHYTHLRVLLAIAMIAVIGLTVAVAILAANDGGGTSATSAAADQRAPTGPEFRLPSHGIAPVPDLGARPLPNGQRYDGGPEEGTRGTVAAQAPITRPDGGPEEGSREPGR